MKARVGVSVVLTIILLVLIFGVSVVYANGEFLERLEYTRGFSNYEWYTTGTATVGYYVSEDAYFYQNGDSVIKYYNYEMVVDGQLLFLINRNSHNPGWRWQMLATIQRVDGTSEIRTADTGYLGDRGHVPLYRGEKVSRVEFKAYCNGDVDPAHFYVLKLWTKSIEYFTVYMPIVR